jgi:hypothetical protein
MKTLVRYVPMVGMLIMLTFVSSGCLGLMYASPGDHDKAVAQFPTYAETKVAWGNLPEGYSRTVIFFPRYSAKVAANIALGFGGYSTFIIKIDDMDRIPIVDQTFVFIDLPVGKHSISCGGGSKPIEFDSINGEVKYIKLDRSLSVVTSEEAETLLVNMHHSFKEPLSCNKQNKSVNSVWSTLGGKPVN